MIHRVSGSRREKRRNMSMKKTDRRTQAQGSMERENGKREEDVEIIICGQVVVWNFGSMLKKSRTDRK